MQPFALIVYLKAFVNTYQITLKRGEKPEGVMLPSWIRNVNNSLISQPIKWIRYNFVPYKSCQNAAKGINQANLSHKESKTKL